MRRRIENKVALVTGGNSGIGRAIAVAFAKAGAKVVVAARNVSKGEETVQIIRELGGDCLYLKTDVSKSEDVRALIQKTLNIYGRLDYAVNNAGVGGEQKAIFDSDEEDWDRVINVNLKGTWLCMKYEIPPMIQQGGGVIINMSSIGGLVYLPLQPLYMASKHGILALTKSASFELASKNIRVNSVCPGIIDTPMVTEAIKDPKILKFAEAMSPIGRIGKPEEVAAAVLWLCSEEASFITGITLSIDGGFTQH